MEGSCCRCTCPSRKCKNPECVSKRAIRHAAKLAARQQKVSEKKQKREAKRASIEQAHFRRAAASGLGASQFAEKLEELQKLASEKAAAIEIAAIAAGAMPSPARPALVAGVCPECNGPVANKREQRCVRCMAIYRTRQDLAGYVHSLTSENAHTQIELYEPVDDPKEVEALALCDVERDAQATMDAVILRETKRIRSRWDEETRHARAGRIFRPSAVIAGWDN